MSDAQPQVDAEPVLKVTESAVELYSGADVPKPVRLVVKRTPSFDALLEGVPLFDGLPTGTKQEFLDRCISRTFSRGEQLRGMHGGTASMVHVVLRGCVAEHSLYSETVASSILRFRGKGSIIGAMDIFMDDLSPMTAECLDTTWTLSYPLDRIRVLAEVDTMLMRNLGQAVAMHLRSSEQIYAPCRKTSAQRIATLLLELVEICGRRTRRRNSNPNPDSPRTYIISGPSQSDIADALMISTATVENVLRTLRDMELVETNHRRFAINDVLTLKGIASGVITVESPYKKKIEK